jgi:predicted DCC family thiol-disulfide oxidoreductase YuxK
MNVDGQTWMNETVQAGGWVSGAGEPRGRVLYDDACGFCRRWVPFWGLTLRKRGFEILPLQSAWVREHLRLTDAELLEDLRLVLQDGGQVAGAEVYRYLMRRIWWAYPVYLFAVAPGLRSVFNWGYRTFARNRYRFSRACGMLAQPRV